jgi:hypothetical protein
MFAINVSSEETVVEPWGGFVVQKSFTFPKDASGGGPTGVVVQTVEKKTSVTVHQTPDRVLTTSKDIAAFTSNNVKYATHTYSELFPILNGVSRDADNFQNGAVLRYVKDKGKWYADDEPPTSGTITMTGTIGFVPLDVSMATAIQTMTDTQKGTLSDFLGATWSFAQKTPANGLGYTETTPVFRPAFTHTVKVTWDKDGKDSRVESSVQPVRGGTRRRKRRTRKTQRR